MWLGGAHYIRERSEGSRTAAVSMKGNKVPGREDDRCKGLEVGMSLVCLKDSNKTSLGHCNDCENKRIHMLINKDVRHNGGKNCPEFKREI